MKLVSTYNYGEKTDKRKHLTGLTEFEWFLFQNFQGGLMLAIFEKKFTEVEEKTKNHSSYNPT